jgi:predicted N-formylglutamate amidohydrolase
MKKLIITCEHGGNKLPEEYYNLIPKNVLNSHKAWDPGAIEIFKKLCSLPNYFCLASETSRLLIELNRSINHRNLFSIYSRNLSPSEKKIIIEKFYSPFRKIIFEKVKAVIESGFTAIHLSIHTFTPILNGKKRNADIGILYDPKNKGEKNFSAILKEEIIKKSGLKVRFNYPYLGISDGHATYLRKKLGYKKYLGIELEVNQKFYLEMNNNFDQLINNLKDALESSMLRFQSI